MVLFIYFLKVLLFSLFSVLMVLMVVSWNNLCQEDLVADSISSFKSLVHPIFFIPRLHIFC